MIELFSDGGTIGRNPSSIGGTWTWVCVVEGRETARQSGIILPEMVYMKTVSNNLAELYAAIEALSFQPPLWEGTLYSDSLTTLRRVTNGQAFNGIPQFMRQKCLDLRRMRKYNYVLLGGHPTKAELLEGKRWDGKPVSKWNVMCDKECTRLANEFKEQLKI